MIEKMARPEGLEPPTLCLEGRCSIHLSYGRIGSVNFRPFILRRIPVLTLLGLCHPDKTERVGWAAAPALLSPNTLSASNGGSVSRIWTLPNRV